MACYEDKGVKYTEEELVKLLQSQQLKTRRILEVQSDLFQKGRDKEFLVDNYKHTPGDRNFNVTYEGKEYKVGTMGGMQRVVIYKTLEGQIHNENPKQDWLTQEEIPQGLKDIVSNKFNSLKQEVLTQNKSNKENQFLQLLNKDNNWVTFFIKSIIQDSAKKGYEKVLFPTGNTASKVEGHTTLEEFKKQKEDRIKELEERLFKLGKDTTKLNSNLSIFNKSQSSNFDSNNLKNDDLALMLFNQALGLNLTSINELTWNNIKDNIFFEKEDGSLGVKNLAFTSGNLLSTKKTTLNDFINQKGLFPEYKVFIGESIIYPNVFETLEENDIIKQAIFENLFNLSDAFEQVKKELNNHSPETFIIETPKGKFTFPKRFASGFWNIASTVELLLKENQSSYIQDYLSNKRKREEVIKDGKKIKPIITQTLTVNDSVVQNAIGLIGNSIIENAIKNNTSVKIQVFSNTEYSEDGIAGWYLPASNTIYLHESMLKPQHLSEGLPLIAHELIHSVTEQSLQFDKNFQGEIQALLDSVKNQSSIKDFYGFKNTSEFLSEAFSSQEFRELLKNTQFSNTEKLSVWQKFINTILKLFGKNVKYTEKTIQSNAEQILNNIINQHSYKIGFVNSNITDKVYSNKEITTEIQNIKNEINQLKQELERVETEGFGALKPIYNFYENTVTNILKKQGLNPVQITDEYGNTWNEVNLNKDSKNVIFFDSSIPTKKAVEKIEKIYKPVILHRLQDGSPVIDNTLYLSQGYKYAEKFKKEFGFIPSGVITTQRMMNKNQRSFYVLRINEEALKQKLDGEQQEMFDATIPDLVAALNKTAEEQVVIQDQIDRVKQEAVSVEKKINKIENKFLRSSMRDALKGINSGDTERSLQNFTYFILEVDKVLKYYSDTLKKIRSKPIQDQVGELESAKQLAENFKAIATFLKREFQYIDDRNEFKSLINSLNSNLDQIESIYGRQAEIVSLERVYENLKEDEKIAFKKINDEIQVLTKQIAVANSNGAGKSYRDTLQARLDSAIAKREKFVPTKEMISDTFKGLRGDLGWTSGNLRSALAMGDPIISGYARKLKEGFNKVRRAIIPIREQAFEILQKYESKLGLSRNLPQSKFYEGLFQIQESAFYNEDTGKIEKEEHYSLLSPYEERFYSDLLEKQVKVKKLKKASATLEEIKEAEKDLNAFLDTYVERKYKKEWYDRYDLLTPEAAKARQDLLDQEQELLRNSEDTLTDAQLELLHELKHKRKALGSTFNKDGTKKTGDALKMAESIQAFNKETSRMSKWEITPLNREWFKTMLEKKKNQLESGLITQKQFDTWLSLNTQRKISDEFYKERTALLDVIHSIMNKLPKEQFKEDVKALWDEILDSARPYRDEDNITDGTVMDQNLVGSVKEREDKIEELKSKLVRFSGLTIEEEQELSGLFQSLESLTPQEIQRFMQLKDEQQSYKDYISSYISPVEMSTLMSAFSKLAAISRWVPTTYYVETYNEKLNEFRQKVDPGFLQDIHLIEEQFILQDEWYRANHVTKTVKQYDDFGGVYYSTVDEPLYIWKDIIPTNEAI